MTSGQRHTDHIENGQRVSRHSLPTLCFLFFSHPHFLKTNKRSDSRAPLKNKLNKRVILSHLTSGTFGFARHTSRPFANAQHCQWIFILKNALANFVSRTPIKNHYIVSKTIRATFLPTHRQKYMFW